MLLSNRVRVLPLVVAAAVLLGPSAAQALTASVGTAKQELTCEIKAACTTAVLLPLSLVDTDGADNGVRVRVIRGTPSATYRGLPLNIEIVRVFGPLTAGNGCQAEGEDIVRCALPPNALKTSGVTEVGPDGSVFDLGAGDDVLFLDGDNCFADRVNGGPGNDVLRTAAAYSGCLPTWDGGPGADRVTGSSAKVSYADRTEPVTVTVGDGANDGAPGEGDDVESAYSVTGGSGADSLTGDARTKSGLAYDSAGFTNALFGGPGNDMLAGASNAQGGPGNDVIAGGRSWGFLTGDEGDDRITASEAGSFLDAGDGNDVLVGGPGNDSFRWKGTVQATGGDGDDWFSLIDGDKQILDGGPGKDELVGLYPIVGNGPSIRITLDGVANDGRKGQRNNVSGFEAVRTKRGTIVGSSADETLEVEDGSVFGRGGDDVLTGSRIIDGGPGNDIMQLRYRYGATGATARFRARDGQRDVLRCSTGRVVRVVELKRDPGDKVTGCRQRKRR